MKLVMIMPIFNEIKKGNLERVLKNSQKVGFDHLIILDDGSTDGSFEMSKQYTDLVFRNDKNSLISNGVSRWYFLSNKVRELFPDCWVYVQSADCVLSKQAFGGRLKEILSDKKLNHVTKIRIKEPQLWRSDVYHRIDNTWGWYTNTGLLRMWRCGPKQPFSIKRIAELHRGDHFPKIKGSEYMLQDVTSIHYGWSSLYLIISKFERYMEVSATSKNPHYKYAPTPAQCPNPEICHTINSFGVLSEYHLKTTKLELKWFDIEDMPNLNKAPPESICYDSIIERYNPKMAPLYRDYFIKLFGEYRGIDNINITK